MMDFLAAEALSPELAEAIDRYWNATDHAQQRHAYFDALAHGQAPGYGEDWARAEPCPTEWAQFQPGAPLFAIPHRGPRPWPFPMLVEFDDG